MNHSTPALPVHHQLLEFTQKHVHQVDDAIQPSHPLSSPSPAPQSLPASGSFPMRKRPLFAWGGQNIGVSASASVLPMNTQDWSPLGRTGWTSLQSKGLSRVFSNTTVQKHQFFGAQLSSQPNSHVHTPLARFKNRRQRDGLWWWVRAGGQGSSVLGFFGAYPCCPRAEGKPVPESIQTTGASSRGLPWPLASSVLVP